MLTVAISVTGFFLVLKQIKQTNKNLRQNNHTSIYSINTSIYQFIAEHSEIRPYFHEGKPLLRGDPNRNKVLSIAEMFADFFEYILIEEKSLSTEISDPWKSYMKKMYSRSSAFREFLAHNNDQYSEILLDFLGDTKILPDIPFLTLALIDTENDFTRLDGIYQKCFGGASVPTAIQKRWWTTYRKGMIGLWLDDEVVGGLSYWPIKSNRFEQFKQGTLSEKDFQESDFELAFPDKFYISEIAIHEDYRGKKNSIDLMSKFFFEIEVYFNLKKRIEIAALGFSETGETILTQIGFSKIVDKAQSRDQQPIYLLSIESYKQFNAIKRSLTKK